MFEPVTEKKIQISWSGYHLLTSRWEKTFEENSNVTERKTNWSKPWYRDNVNHGIPRTEFTLKGGIQQNKGKILRPVMVLTMDSLVGPFLRGGLAKLFMTPFEPTHRGKACGVGHLTSWQITNVLVTQRSRNH
ncbi:hypothetical protein SUGI_1184890 [Cryptomeria japonica]|nr:hypothetical protein SUGI_1184890 [Cryptomeria japonica]